MKLTPSSIARRSAAIAWSRLAGGPQIPWPVTRIAPNPSRFTVRSPPMLIVPAAKASGRSLIAIPAFRNSDPHAGRSVVIDDQDQLAASVPAFDLAMRLSGVLPVMACLHRDGQRAVVEPGGNPDHAAPPRQPVVLPPANPVVLRDLRMHRRRQQRSLSCRPDRPPHG